MHSLSRWQADRVPQCVLDRNELGTLLVQAGLGSPRDRALIGLLAITGVRISDVDDSRSTGAMARCRTSTKTLTTVPVR